MVNFVFGSVKRFYILAILLQKKNLFLHKKKEQIQEKKEEKIRL